MYIKESKIRCSMGDRIRAVVGLIDSQTVEGIIIKIIPRYEKIGKRSNPLVYVKTDKEVETFDASYITDVLEYTKCQPALFNIYKQQWKPEPRWCFKTLYKRRLNGPLNLLAQLMLAKSNKEVLTEIDYRKLEQLYLKNPIGMIKRERISKYSECYFYTVNEKRFRKWIEWNRTKILCTVKEMIKRDTTIEQDLRDEYYKDLEDEYLNLEEDDDDS